jgi:protein-S-isoprenylcysteine O-methyltransferase Ste14
MSCESVESVIRWLGGLLAYTLLGVVFYGIWRGTQRQAGRITGKMGHYLRSPWFYLVTSALYFVICYLGWISLPLNITPHVHVWMLGLGTLLYFPGMSLTLWARLALGKNYFVSTGFGAQLFEEHQLVANGPFAFVRHPMYAGLILAAFGSLLIYHTWTTLLFALFAPALFFRARREETALAAEFGEQWQEYCKRVPAFFPRLGKERTS